MSAPTPAQDGPTKGQIRVQGDNAYIALTDHDVTIMDARDLPLLQGRNVHLLKCEAIKYAIVAGPQKYRMPLHRLVMGDPKGLCIDHIDGDGLNNRRANLRVATNAQNNWNTGPKRNNTSGHKGVSWRADRGKWQVHIRVQDRRLSLGHYERLQDAADAYAAAARQYHGEFANLGRAPSHV